MQESKWSRGYFVTFLLTAIRTGVVYVVRPWFALAVGRRYNALDDKPNKTEVYHP